VGVWEGLLWWNAVAEIGGGAVCGADAAGGYDFADVDGEGEVTGPNLDVVSNIARWGWFWNDLSLQLP
jgi:hypothetical protein